MTILNPRPDRIRHVLPEFGRVPMDLELDPMSGIVKVAITLAVKQAGNDHAVQLFGLNRDRGRLHYRLAAVDVFTNYGFPYLKLGQNDWRYFVPLYLDALRARSDILHTHDNPFLLSLPGVQKRLLHIHTPISPRSTRAFSRAVQKANLVICNSRHIRDDFLAHVDYPSERVHVLYNGVDLEHFNPPQRNLRREFGIPETDLVILYVGQISWEKGLLHLLHAFQELVKYYPLHLLVAGSSTLWQTIHSTGDEFQNPYEIQVRQVSQGLPVHFLGKVPTGELAAVYHAADVFVCPSDWPEPFGMVNVEAMAASKPVVASLVGGIPEIIQDGETGYLVPQADPASLARSLRLLLENRELRQQMGQAGRKRVEKVFTWTIILGQLDQIYSRLSEYAKIA